MGSIAPIFAVMLVPLVIAVGGAVDVASMVDTHGSMQDVADSAALAGAAAYNGLGDPSAAVSAAEAYAKAMGAKLPDHPTVSAQASCSPSSTVALGTLTAFVCATPPSVATNYIGTVQVYLVDNTKTPMAGFLKSSMVMSVQATAQGNAARNVNVTQISAFSSDAGDLNQIYMYATPGGYTGTTLYQWTPSLSASSPILSNAAGFSNPTVGQTALYQVPISGATASGVGFALKNTTGGRSAYGANCYGQAQGTTYLYYSHREDNAQSYWDYGAPAFKPCTASGNNWSAELASSGGYEELAPCNSSDASEIGSIGGVCASSANYPAGNYIYYTDSNTAYKPYDPLYGTMYSRNPLKFGTTNMDCTQGPVTYEWDDNGGSDDDNDFNDAVFTADCSTIAIQKSSVRLIK